jgi:type IV pilus assembly protein PilY1
MRPEIIQTQARIRLLLILAILFGAFFSGHANATVTIDQTPLTVESPLAPNIMLMLDDSGSMAWDFMPDICYLDNGGTNSDGSAKLIPCNTDSNGNLVISSTPSFNALTDAKNNGVYYDPTVTYTPPTKVDGTSYPNATGITSAWVNGFSTSVGTVDITSYALVSIGTGSSSSQATSTSSCTYAYTGGGAGSYETCTSGSGAAVQGSNVPFSIIPSTSTFYTTPNVSTSSSSNCSSLRNADPAHTSTSYSYNSGVCNWTDYYHYFIYSTGAATGPYTTYYVASAAQGCGTQSNCVTESDTSGTAAPAGVAAGQNIANWFSYYHTRLLTAKSGLTSAFDSLDYTVRLGFGSINGRNNTNLPSSTFTGSSATGSIKVATVAQFDQACTVSTTSPCTPGASTTQRSKFWTWVTGESASGGTNLRYATDTLGQYYSTAGPWQTSSSDSTELACRQSYAIVTTDGFWNDNYSGTNVDGTAGSQIRGANGQSYTYSPVAPYSDTYSSTLADVAMKYWVTDLRPTTSANEVPTSTEDPAFWQHMTTFTVGLGFTPTGISPTGTTVDQIFAWANGGAAISGFSWPAPASNSINNIADLAHAAVNGHGGFYSATSPQAFSSGISDALKRVSTRNGTGASLAANSTTLQTGTVTYQAIYHSGIWLGELDAYNVDSTTGSISSTATWKANASSPAASSRNIYTYNPSGANAAAQYIAFSSPSTLSPAEQTALGSSSTAQQDMINYLRGDPSKEQRKGGTFRNRVINNAAAPLGDIIDSQPVYVGAPDPNLYYNKTFTGSTSYSAFASTNLSRTAAIWVAANDGMLHAFKASDGSELFAYLPGAVITNSLTNLSNPDYGSVGLPHQDYNDGLLTVADAYLGGAWKTVLVGTTGRGSTKAVYALDITSPSAPVFLWERSAGDGLTNSNYIGQMTGQPVITQTADGTWSVLISNGYNSAANTAALLQFDLAAGGLTVHTTSTTVDNGLAAPTVWFSNATNEVGTTAYAGDLAGKVWSFDLSSSSSAGTLLFTTQTGQPITGGMLAGKDPQTSNIWLFFGTGRYLTQNDLSSTTTQTWYGIIVQAGPSQSSSLVTNLSGGTTNLVQRSILSQTDPNPNATPATLGSRTISTASAGDMLNKSGWYINLLKPGASAQGERMVTPNQFQGSLLIGTTLIPTSSDPCNPSGTGWIMAINPFTGTNPSSPFFNTDGTGGFDTSAVGFNSIPNNPIFVGNTMLTSFNDATNSSIPTAGSSGTPTRTSWRELFNH